MQQFQTVYWGSWKGSINLTVNTRHSCLYQSTSLIKTCQQSHLQFLIRQKIQGNWLSGTVVFCLQPFSILFCKSFVANDMLNGKADKRGQNWTRVWFLLLHKYEYSTICSVAHLAKRCQHDVACCKCPQPLRRIIGTTNVLMTFLTFRLQLTDWCYAHSYSCQSAAAEIDWLSDWVTEWVSDNHSLQTKLQMTLKTPFLLNNSK